jgi:hypothetical protein
MTCLQKIQLLIDLLDSIRTHLRVGKAWLLEAVGRSNRHFCVICLGAGRHLNEYEVMFNPIVLI